MAVRKTVEVDEMTLGNLVERLINAESQSAEHRAHLAWINANDRHDAALIRWVGLVAIAIIVGFTIGAVANSNAMVDKPAVECKCATAGERCTCGETCNCKRP